MRRSVLPTLLVLWIGAAGCMSARGARHAAPAAAAVVDTGARTVVDRQLAAYNARDAAAFAETYAEDARIYTFPDALWLQGRAQVAQAYATFFATAPALHATIAQRIVQGTLVIDHERVTGIAAGPPVEAVAIYEVKDGRIARAWLAR